MRLGFVSGLGLLVGLLAGCQDGISVDATADTFCDEYAEVACHNMYQCCTEEDIESNLGVTEPRTEAQCREDKKRECVRGSAELRDSLDAGRVTFNADAFNNCLDALLAPDGSCAMYVDKYPWTDACKEQPWVGTVAVGGACFFNHDCAGAPKSAVCGPDQKCAALPVGGFPCMNGACAEDFFCGTGSICQAKLAEGTPCTSDFECQDELFCDPDATPAPACASRKAGGEACTGDQSCLSGDCVPGQCRMTGTSCYTDDQCFARCADDNGFCDVGMDWECNTSGHCDQVVSVTCSGSTADDQCVTAAAGTKCVFNVACVPGECVGDPVCTAPLYLADYCLTGMGLVP